MTNEAINSRKSMAEEVYDALKEAILGGGLAPGEPLRQDVIAKRYGMSKIPVREALLKLEAEGYVLFRKNRGAIVRGLSSAEVLHLMDIRSALECKALELAIPNLAGSDITLAREILDHYSDDGRPEGWSDMNRRFHHALYEPCGNAQLLEMIEDIQYRIGPIARLLITETTGFSRPDAEHREILAACEVGDIDGATELLRKHIETSKKEAAAKLRRKT